VSSALLVPYGAKLPPPGVPRRLYAAAAGTMLFAAAIAVAGSAAGHPSIANTIRLWSQTVALLSAVGYLLAFSPPRWLRGWWAGTAALSVGRQLMDAPVTEAPEETWPVRRPGRPGQRRGRGRGADAGRGGGARGGPVRQCRGATGCAAARRRWAGRPPAANPFRSATWVRTWAASARARAQRPVIVAATGA
jgi:hypothetical protein